MTSGPRHAVAETSAHRGIVDREPITHRKSGSWGRSSQYSQIYLRLGYRRKYSGAGNGDRGLYARRPPAVHGEVRLFSYLRRRRGKGSPVSVQRHLVFVKERVRKMGSSTGFSNRKWSKAKEPNFLRCFQNLLQRFIRPEKIFILCDQNNVTVSVICVHERVE
jgi:hypothetical protein